MGVFEYQREQERKLKIELVIVLCLIAAVFVMVIISSEMFYRDNNFKIQSNPNSLKIMDWAIENNHSALNSTKTESEVYNEIIKSYFNEKLLLDNFWDLLINPWYVLEFSLQSCSPYEKETIERVLLIDGVESVEIVNAQGAYGSNGGFTRHLKINVDGFKVYHRLDNLTFIEKKNCGLMSTTNQ